VKADVKRHVLEREMESETDRTALLCNSGYRGSGKTTLLLHTAVEAVGLLQGMVNSQVGAAEQHRWRPLGFYVTFNSDSTNADADGRFDVGREMILTRIALRMAYSVIADVSTEVRAGYTNYACLSHPTSFGVWRPIFCAAFLNGLQSTRHYFNIL
jgi:hypothetical protein